jgi:hypothetical protein
MAPAGALVTEALVHDAVADQEDGHADQHPEAELQVVELLGLGDEVEGDGGEHGAAAQSGQRPDDPPGHGDPTDEEPADEQRRLRHQPEPERPPHRADATAPPAAREHVITLAT